MRADVWERRVVVGEGEGRGGLHRADDFSPVQTSSSAALYLQPRTACYCSSVR